MEDEIKSCEEKLLNAMKAGDISELDKLLHNDLLFVIPTGQNVSKSMDMENLRSGNLKILDISSNNQVIKIIDGNAIVSVTIHLHAIFLDQEIKGEFKYLRLWKKFENDWKVIGGAGFQLMNT